MQKRILLVVIVCTAIFMGCPKKAEIKPEESAKAPVQQEEPKAVPSPAMPAEAITLKSVNFDFDSSNIRSKDAEILKENAKMIKANQDVKMVLEGNCDERGTNEYNMALGERRANSVKAYLLTLGIDAGRLSSVSYGEEKPVCTESDESCWWKNRRVDLIISK